MRALRRQPCRHPSGIRLAFYTTIFSAWGNQYLRQMQGALFAMLRTGFEIVSQKRGGSAASLPDA